MSIEEVIIETVNKAVKEALNSVQVNTNDDFPEIMNVKQAAKFLNCGTTWIYENIEQIPHFELSGYKFIKSQLMDWVINRTGRSFKLVRNYK